MLVRLRHRRWWKGMALVLAPILAAGLGLYLWLLADLPSLDDPAALYAYAAAPSSKVYDRHGRLLFDMPPPYSGFHSPVPLEEMPAGAAPGGRRHRGRPLLRKPRRRFRRHPALGVDGT